MIQGHLFWNIISKKIYKKSRTLKISKSILEFNHIPQVEREINGNNSETFTRIRSFQLDFILNFSKSEIGSEIVDFSKFGVWSFQFGKMQVSSEELIGYNEIDNKEKTITAYLLKENSSDPNRIILRKGELKISYSLYKNIDSVIKESIRWPAILCEDILNNNTKAFKNKILKEENNTVCKPTNIKIIIFLLKVFSQKLTEIWRLLFYVSHWNIGIAHSPIHKFLEKDAFPEIKWYPHLTKNKFIADPFAFKDKNKLHILYEAFPFGKMKGRIDYVEYINNEFINDQICIQEDFHMSYPYLIKQDKTVYMIPETWENRKITLYKVR